MIHLKWITTILLVAFATGCDDANNDPVKTAADSTKVELAAASSAAQTAAEEMRAFSYEQRTQFLQNMNAQVEALREQVTTLATKVEGSTAAVKKEAAPKLEALRTQMAALEKQLLALTSATPSTWEGIKADSLKAYVAVGDGFDQARQWISDTIAPERQSEASSAY